MRILFVVLLLLPCLPADLRSQSGARLPLIVLDAGHGGTDSGARNAEAGLTEKDAALSAAQALEKAFLQDRRLTVLLTRTGDIEMPLHARAEKANRARGQLLISIHTGFDTRADRAGARVYFLGPAHLPAAVSAKTVTGVKSPASLVPWAEAQVPFVNESNDLALLLQARLNTPFLSIHSVQSSPLLLLHFCAMPAVLVELGNLADPADLTRLTSEEGRSQWTPAVKSSVYEYLFGNTR